MHANTLPLASQLEPNPAESTLLLTACQSNLVLLQYWITVNEPWCAAVLGHDSGGQHAPGRTVDPAREVYKVAHHMLIAHGRTYQMYQ
jgi:beta-glucosidase/6-phospho-beta-glucosidase/beta-galactosidase